MGKESPRLRGLIGNLHKPNPARRVRLVGIIFPRWVREHRGDNAASESEDKARHPFDVDLGARLGLSWSAVEKMRAKARTIPAELLKEIEFGDIPRQGPLLEKLERALRSDAKAMQSAPDRAKRLALVARGRTVVAEHVSPSPIVPARRLAAGGFTFMSDNVRSRLEVMVSMDFKVDAIITDPPYRVGFEGRDIKSMTGDDRKDPIWEPALFAKLIKPNRAICLFCNKDSLADWTTAVLEAGLIIERLVRWHKPHAQWRGKGDDTKGDELVLICGIGIPQTFGDGASLRKITMPTLTAAERKALGVEDHRTPKPPALMVRLIEAFTQPRDTILDPFAGTGPVGVAALLRGRRYIGAEIEPDIAAKTIQRLREVRFSEDGRHAAAGRIGVLAGSSQVPADLQD